ncbi:Surfactin synthase subunit 2 [Sedimentisphaera cyanobacteriorum]|uniref:Surfactin synthase subunit 2 n=1 Tax=Sedimentisphaera cyanobacteriorum TaxID=1940790 RepID=A0A1Q2HNW5_9BACT|nr:non-ribosomal peptide synthetase [Sedimentisphaera cyanobacteriorum]AQQ08935.1 Surfactin synthase subunit 2 [Sedimentisphaera cyanobacteriorum]
MNNIVDMFLEQAQATPELTVLIQGEQALNYRQLDNASENIAKIIEDKGLAGQIVGIYTSRSIEFIASALGIMKAGCIYVSLDSKLPQARLDMIIRDADIRLVFSQPDISPLQSSVCPEIIDVETDSIKESRPLRDDNAISDENLAYVIFTSGSTGEPKGTVIPHRCLANFINWMVVAYNFKAGTKTSWVARPSFDASLFEIWPYLASGGSISIPPEELLYEPQKLVEWVTENNLDTCFMPTPLAESCLDLDWPEGCRLKYLFSGGDALRKAPKPDAPFKMFDHYGPSECTVVSTYAEITHEKSENISPNIGVPISGARVYILDENLNPVKEGQVGEIYIAGEGVGRGYLNDPELTKAKFLPDKFSKSSKNKMYKTGDLGAKLKDGTIEFHGRTDRMVKIRGFRIELGEIESVILRQPYISEAAVVLQEGQASKKIIAFAAASDKDTKCLEKLKKAVSENLPSYMMPSKILFLDSLPKTLNGKIDRLALASGEYFNLSDNNENADPKELSDKEKAIFEIWEEVLGDDNFSADTNFFDAGGHSLKAFKVASRINEKFGCSISVKDIFDNPTVLSLTEAVKKSDKASVIEVESKGLEKAPATPGQIHMRLLDSLSGDLNACNIVCDVKIKGLLDRAAFEKTINYIIETQHSLRMSVYLDQNSNDFMISADDTPPVKCLDYKDLSYLNENQIQSKLSEIIEEFRNIDLNLDSEPVCRFFLIKLSTNNHRLVSVFHHGIADGSSVGIFVKLLKECYISYLSEDETLPPPPEINYIDYADWINSWLDGREAAKQLKFWKNKLKGISGKLDLSCVTRRPDYQTFKGDREYFSLTEKQSGLITNLCRSLGTTEYPFLLLAYAIVLRNKSNDDDIVIGSPISNRPDPSLDKIIGLFINSITHRINLAEKTGINELIKRLHSDTLDAFENQTYPFEELVATLNLPKDNSRHPVFQHYFIFQNAHIPYINFAGLELELDEIGNHTAKIDLTLNLENSKGIIKGWFEYNTDLFSESVVKGLTDDFIDTAEKMTAGRVNYVSDLISFAPLQSSQRNYNFQSVPERISLFSSNTPNKIAVEQGDSSLTYKQLEKASDALANELKISGVENECKVGIYGASCIEFIVSCLSVMKAGGCFVPLDVKYPNERIGCILEDGNIDIVLNCAEAEFPLKTKQILDVELQKLLNSDNYPLNVSLSPDFLAYTIYTSGSAGRPKGVEIEHRNLAYLVDWENDFYSYTPNDRMSQLSRVSFDTSIAEIWPTLSCGASVHIAEADTVYNPNKLIKWICENEITVADVTTPLAEIVISENWPDNISLRIMKTGGDRLKKFPLGSLPFTFFNEYGPTECCVTSTSGIIGHKEESGEFPHIGKAVPGSFAYILDESLKPVEEGCEGELFISGPCVGRGYVNLPEQTAERFLDDPFVPGLKMYKTGDVVRRRPDGNIDYIGRKDFQIQIRGFRVELSEIEKAALKYEFVSQAAAVDLESAGAKKLCCFVTLNEQSNFDKDKLKETLINNLPEYMIPAYIIPLDDFPMNTNGKIDRELLKHKAYEYEKSLELSCENKPAIKSNTEKAIAEIWSEILGHSNFSSEDNFFQSGGHSLMAFKVVSKINHKFGTNINITDFFKSPYISSLAEKADSKSNEQSVEIEPTYLNESPAVPSQIHMWLLDSFVPEINICSIICNFEILGELDVELLELAVKKLVEYQQCLRLKFEISDSYLIKESKDHQVDYVFHDLSNMPDDKAEDLSEEIICGFRDSRFDLKEGQVCRFSLIKYDSQTYSLLAGFHHAVFDGFSLGVFEKQLKGIYENLLIGGDIEKFRPEISYFDYSLWLQKWLSSEDAQSQKRFWIDKLHGIKGLLKLDCTLPRPETQTFEGRRYYFNFGKDRSDEFHNFCSRHSVTEYMLLLTAYSIMLRKHSETDEIIIGSPIANRPNSQTEQLVGLFINSIVQKLNVSRGKSVFSLLDSIKTDTVQAFTNQNYPFENLVQELNLVKYPSAHPVFQHLFSFQNAHTPESELGSCRIRVDDIGNNTAKVDLTLDLESRDGIIEGWFEYNTNIFNYSVISKLSNELLEITDKIIASPNSNLSDFLPSSTFENIENVSTEDSELEVPKSFVKYAELNPDKPAVCDYSHYLTYQELDKVTDLLASKLISAGVKADSRVAVLYDRGIEFTAAALAVLKAGGGYVPVDPDYPEERINYIIQNAQVSCVFASKNRHYEKLLEAVPFIDVDIEQLKNKERQKRICSDVSEESLAYVIYTSGSTGRPKGVEVERRSLKNLINWQVNFYKISLSDRASNLARTCFDTSVSEIWPYLMAGASVHIPPERIIFNIEKLIDWLCANRITICDMTTRLAELAVFENWPCDCSLKVLKTGGERLSKRPPEGLSFDLYNEYGPTECTVIATCGKVSPAGRNDELPDIGDVISGNKAHILGPDLKPAAKGGQGELCISGKSVARGYLGLEDETKEKFVQSPFNPAERMYRTGDIVCRKENGNLEFIHRKDSQIQVRGFRVEPGEIEKAVMEYAGVKEAAVAASDSSGSEKKLLLFAVPEKRQSFKEEDLRAYIRGKLPDYMQPAQIFTIDKIPLNQNGKTDRDALLKSAQEGLSQSEKAGSGIVMPRNPMEEVLRDIWVQLLERSDFGVYDNFFDLGGHSLMLIKMDSLLSERGLFVGIEKILQYPEIAGLAGFLDFKNAGGADSSEEKCLVELNKGSRQRLPVYFIHSLSGDVLGYANMVHHLGKDQPCYGFQSAGLSDLNKAHKTLPEMAEYYVNLLLDFQPEGPYLLLGWCFGGFIAYEMAQMLQDMGRKVGMLLMVDVPSMPPADINLPYYFDLAWNLASLGPVGMFKFIISYLKKHKQFESVEEIIGEHFSRQDDEIKNKYVSNREDVYKMNLNAARTHKIHKYDGDIILCTASEREHWLLRGAALGWKNFVNNVELKVIPGDHGFIIRKSKVLPAFIRGKIDQIIQAN